MTTTLAPLPSRALLGAMPTVSLAGLNASAEMLTRVDRKYVVADEDTSWLLEQLPADTRVLEIGDRRSHSYRSLYFDTPDLVSFHGAAHPRRRRFKVRTRTYDDTGTAFLEVKTRGPRGRTVKDRLPIPMDEAGAGALGADEQTWLRTMLGPTGADAARVASLRPVLGVEYRRTTLLMGEGERATLDTDLVWTDADGRRLTLPGVTIIETKSGGRASVLDHLMWSRGHRPARFSKYATALTALHPELPANRWARTLRWFWADDERRS